MKRIAIVVSLVGLLVMLAAAPALAQDLVVLAGEDCVEVNVNTADEEQLQAILHIGPDRAGQIVELRALMAVGPNWEMSELAVNLFERFCIEHGWPATVVPQQRDFGRDVIVDVGEPKEEGGTVLTGEVFAVQVKGGTSYRRESDYFIPVQEHDRYWANATIPVIGVVMDPDDQKLRWANLTAYLTENPDATRVPVAADALLEEEEQQRSMLESLRRTPHLAHALRSFGSLDHRDQQAAVFDCWAVGRRDARVLIGLRRLFLSLAPVARVAGTVALSHCTPHPDIFWTNENWIEPNIKNAVRSQMRWTVAEVEALLELVDENEFARGAIGQCVFHILDEDPDLLPKLRDVLLIGSASDEVLHRALLVVLYGSPDPLLELNALLREAPSVRGLPQIESIREHAAEHRYIDLF